MILLNVVLFRVLKAPKYIIGIDEAGRGPLAGPVAVGVAMVSTDFDWKLLSGVGDSKQVTPKIREVIFARAKELAQKELLIYSVVMTSANKIDKIGIVPAIKQALEKALAKVVKTKPELIFGDFYVKLDGGLKAPKEFLNQETIIKGDAKELVIGLASIMAKVTRDKYMEKLAKQMQYMAYDFATHKGYGTKKHREAINRNGLSKEHRASFCQRCIKSQV
jgi:ribonuclease HII